MVSGGNYCHYHQLFWRSRNGVLEMTVLHVDYYELMRLKTLLLTATLLHPAKHSSSQKIRVNLPNLRHQRSIKSVQFRSNPYQSPGHKKTNEDKARKPVLIGHCLLLIKTELT